MTFACGVVLYHPNKKNIELIESFKDSFDVLLVYDNSEQKNQIGMMLNSTLYVSKAQNDGLGKAYNMFIEYCVERKIDFLCILDQDTMLNVEDISKIKKYIKNFYSDNVAIYAPRLKGTVEKKWVINSNSFLNISVLSENSLRYDEFYFLDRLDADFCKKVNLKGLSIEIMEEVIIDHNIGDGENGEHSAIRHYYMFRNRTYFNFKYYKCIKALCLTLIQDVRHICLILVKERNKKQKLIASLKGRWDYITYKKQRRKKLDENI